MLRAAAAGFAWILAIPLTLSAAEFHVTQARYEALRISLASSLPAHSTPVASAVKAPSWRHHCSENFSVWYPGTIEEATGIATACEDLRSHLVQTWLGETAAWTPRCEIVLHPTLASYTRTLGPGSETSNGCATIQLDSGRVVVRRVDVFADTRERFASALPHELTHVVLADAFSDRQIPRWADEGIAVLAESRLKQEQFAQDLHWSVTRNMAFHLRELFQVQAYPDPHRRGAFYSQSASVVRYLVERGSPRDFVRFVRMATDKDYETALREVYHVEGLAALEAAWSNQFNVYLANARQ